MKKYILFLSAVVLGLSTLLISSCDDDDDGGTADIPPARVKTLSLNESGSITTWEFTYDATIKTRLVSVKVTEGTDPFYTISYDYSQPGKLIENEAGDLTTFILDTEGRITKELWNPATPDDNFTGYEYDANGYLIRWYEKEGGVTKNKHTATVDADGNITEHKRYASDGTTVNRLKPFTYIASPTALNTNNLPQANLRNSERRAVSGFYGKASKKLVDYLELVSVPANTANYRKNSNAYTFDAKNRVATVTRTGVDASGAATSLNEVYTYTYYED
jgi:YD repeat-containing protein